MCGAVGNCPFWLIIGNPQPATLLHAVGIQTFKFQKSVTAAHFNLVVGVHDSAMMTDLQRFRFDGTKYQRNDRAFLVS
jgi:hypothetical protein